MANNVNHDPLYNPFAAMPKKRARFGAVGMNNLANMMAQPAHILAPALGAMAFPANAV